MYKHLSGIFASLMLLYFFSLQGFTQSAGHISGDLSFMMQSYNADSIINAKSSPEKVLMNSYANLQYTLGNFTAGARFESNLNPLQGFDQRNNGTGFPFRFVNYRNDFIDVSLGNFYEQFGNGLIFRSYEDKLIDYDNAVDGLLIKINPAKGIYFKGIYGRQRDYFGRNNQGSSSLINGAGIIRGADIEWNISDWIKVLNQKSYFVNLGASVLSKYQDPSDPIYNLPANVLAAAGRLQLSKSGFSLNSEYAYKINDPSSDNGYIYKPGNTFLLNASYATSGLGILVGLKRVDNMSFRSDRNASINRLAINYIPTISKNHTYSLAAMYPYASQANGEIGIQSEIIYTMKRGSALGGKYGTKLSLNFSRVHALEKLALNDSIPIGTSGTLGYISGFPGIGNELYFQDINVELSKKINKKIKLNLTYLNIFYNYNAIRGVNGHDNVQAHIGIADINYKINTHHAIRVEAQALFTEQDEGDWAMLLGEYSISPSWFFTISDQYNYGNNVADKRYHYYNVAVSYVREGTRIQIGYGKQRQGIICIGGVCRSVPASNGLTVNITSSF